MARSNVSNVRAPCGSRSAVRRIWLAPLNGPFGLDAKYWAGAPESYVVTPAKQIDGNTSEKRRRVTTAVPPFRIDAFCHITTPFQRFNGFESSIFTET